MRLRARLVAATVAVALPVAAGMFWYDARLRQQAARDDLARLTLRHMLGGGERVRCEAAPGSWGGRPLPPPRPGSPDRPDLPPPGPVGPVPDRGEPPGRGRPPPLRPPADHPGAAAPVLYPYDPALRSADPRAPDPPDDDGVWPGRTVRVLVAMPWRTGPCANVLALGTVNPGWQGGLLPGSPIWLVPVGLVLATLLVSVGPVVARLRRLALAVRQSAASGFTGPIPGEGDDEIGELAAAFRAVSGEVQVQLAARDARERSLREFVTSTTHDVMIPLTVLKAHLATLDEERAAGRAIDPAALTGAMAEAHYLGALLHNLGLAARLDAFDPEAARAPTDLTQVVERVLARHRPIARQLDVSLDGAVPDRPLVVDADQTMIEQAVSNLVYNGVRHNRPGGHVGVSLDRDESGFRVRIVDDGPGVPEGELDRLRQRGARGDEARTRAPDGQGLGLSIAGRVADAFGLTLRFARSEFGGLEVVLSGPLAPDPVSPGRPP